MKQKSSYRIGAHTVRVLLALLVCGVQLFSAGPLTTAAPVDTAVAASVTDTPTTVIGSGVAGYTLAAPKLFWYTGVDGCPPRSAPASAPAAQPSGLTEQISRIATYGSSTRQLYSQNYSCGGGKINSNMVADNDFLYWIGPGGLLRLSTSANVGDVPQTFGNIAATYGEVAIGSDKVYVLPGSSSSTTSIFAVDKASGTTTTVVGGLPSGVGPLSYDGQYLYVINNGAVQRIAGDGSVVPIAGRNVGGETRYATSYYAEGSRLSLCGGFPISFCTTSYVYVGIGNQIYRYNNASSTRTAIYTSATSNAIIDTMTANGGGIVGGGYVLFLENRPLPCSGFCFATYNPVLMRTGRGGGTADALYAGTTSDSIQHLTNDGTYIFWQQNGTLQRLAINAAALPVINMRVTGMEVTQGIQNTSNSILLIKNRRTFVRVYVKSDGAAVPSVGAQLSSSLGTLLPVNSVGTKLTVRATPSRNDLNQSFLFELPWSWTNTQSGNLTLVANLNPYRIPLEPTYNDNNQSLAVNFKTSPQLSAEFYRLNYVVGGVGYQPRINKDILQTYSWIMRAYPIGGAIGQNFKPRLWDVAGDTKLGNWVNQTSKDCDKVQKDQDDRSLCASYYTNGWLKYYRDHGWVPNTHDFYYGMISDGAAFPRGQAMYDKTSVGPAGSGTFGWDNDGSYADWYAGHEMGHTLGRPHPTSGSDDPATKASDYCGHSRSGDLSYEHGNTTSARAPIGPSDNSAEGFDVGDPSFGIARAIYPSSIWNDVMSYCSNQWIADYTYQKMYDYMLAHPSTVMSTASVKETGDFLSATGIINPDAGTGSFALLRRISTATTAPAAGTGEYTLRLLDATNNILADNAFAGTVSNEGTGVSFDTLVNFVAGTRTVQVVRTSDSKVLASQAVSANAPTISGVALQGASSPVSGTVTLGWTASDPDGDALFFDIFYSRDNGVTFQPAKMGVAGSSTTIDTAALGGSGTAILRVAASDGVNTTEADTAPFVMANKPPQANILSPGDNTHIHYGQLVNFNGMAFDAQDGIINEAGLVWKTDAGVTLGNGPLVSTDALPVGINKITLTATNSVGTSATATVTVIVDDDLSLPGPTLSAAPGQLGWQIGSGTTDAQTADVTITNAGSGSLAWTATSDQTWLTTSVLTGTVAADGDPSTLTVTANPAGLAADAVYTATLTITKPANADNSEPAQTVIVPVSLSIGNVRDLLAKTLQQPAADRTVYLPLTTR